VDCSHANCHKKHQGQGNVFKNVLEQILQGNEAVLGLMLESNIHEGNQKFTGDVAALKYGVSITDECISWESTEELLTMAHNRLSQVKLQAA
jgi:3-deoxy-7-phosphoheptulonate synthase